MVPATGEQEDFEQHSQTDWLASRRQELYLQIVKVLLLVDFLFFKQRSDQVRPGHGFVCFWLRCSSVPACDLGGKQVS